MSDKKELKSVSYDLNMRVSVAAKLTESQAYWCIPGLQTDGPGKGKFCSYIWTDGVGFPLPDKLKLVLTYPFDRAYTEEINMLVESRWKNRDGVEVVDTYRSDSIGDIVWKAAQAYRRAFQEVDEGRNGAWHSMGDLVFEGMTVYEDGTVKFSVGS